MYELIIVLSARYPRQMWTNDLRVVAHRAAWALVLLGCTLAFVLASPVYVVAGVRQARERRWFKIAVGVLGFAFSTKVRRKTWNKITTKLAKYLFVK